MGLKEFKLANGDCVYINPAQVTAIVPINKTGKLKALVKTACGSRYEVDESFSDVIESLRHELQNR